MQSAAHAIPLSTKPRLLVIDDSSVVHEQLVASLDKDEVEVLHCEDAAKALEMTLELMPDYVLIDHGLFTAIPRQLRRKLRQHPRTAHIPVLFVIGSNQAWESSLHPDDYVTLPFSEPEVDPDDVHDDFPEWEPSRPGA